MLGSYPGQLRLRHWLSDALATRLHLIHAPRLHLIHSPLHIIHTWLHLIHSRLHLIHTRLHLIHNSATSHPQYSSRCSSNPSMLHLLKRISNFSAEVIRIIVTPSSKISTAFVLLSVSARYFTYQYFVFLSVYSPHEVLSLAFFSSNSQKGCRPLFAVLLTAFRTFCYF
jgi:hypothetical protein